MKKLKRILSLILTVIFVLALIPLNVFAEPEIEETVIEDDGTILTKYADGSKKAITPEGDVCLLSTDGTETYYFADGSSQTVSTDGITTHQNADGTGCVLDADNNLITTWEQHGSVVIMSDWKNGSEVRRYFEGGTGYLEKGDTGGFYGTCTSPDGMVYECVQNVDGDKATLTGPDDTFLITCNEMLFEDSSVAGTQIVIKFEDGTEMKTPDDNGNYSLTFPDGSSIVTSPDGYGECRSSDGSYVIKTTSGTESYDAATGNYIKIGADGTVEELNSTDGSVRTVFKNGIYETTNSATGEYSILRDDGSWENGNDKTGKAVIRNADGTMEYIGYEGLGPVYPALIFDKMGLLLYYAKDGLKLALAEFSPLKLNDDGTFQLNTGGSSDPTTGAMYSYTVQDGTSTVNGMITSLTLTSSDGKTANFDFTMYVTDDFTHTVTGDTYVIKSETNARLNISGSGVGTVKYDADDKELEINFEVFKITGTHDETTLETTVSVTMTRVDGPTDNSWSLDEEYEDFYIRFKAAG